MATRLLCLNSVKGIGALCDNITPITLLQGFALLRPGFTFDDAEDFATLLSWQTAIANKNVMLVNNIISQESIKVEDGMHTTPNGQRIKLWDGMRGLDLKAKLTLDQHKIIRTYANLGWDLVRIDRANTLIGVINDDGTVGGFSLATFIVGSQTEPLVDTPPLTPIQFQEEDPGEYNSKGAWVKPSWRVSKLKPMTFLTIEVTTVAAFKFTATIYYLAVSNFSSDGTLIKIPYSGALAANFLVTDQGGAVETCTIEEIGDGIYEVTGVDITSGTLEIVPSATNLYEAATMALVAAV
jgi:hypothetical protein